MKSVVVNELPASLIKELMAIAEKCVIKSNRIGRDEIPDFVQTCLLKLLVQIEQERVIFNEENERYYILKKNGEPLAIEPWFGTAATNISIDRYRQLKHSQDVDTESNYDIQDNSGLFWVPEPTVDLEEEIREQKIREMALYCCNALDECIQEAWEIFAQQDHKNFSMEFSNDAPCKDKGIAIANYCQIILEEKYSNDGKKIHSHNSVCELLGIVINQENIVHKKKKFEKIVMDCITRKVDSEFNNTTKQVLEGGA